MEESITEFLSIYYDKWLENRWFKKEYRHHNKDNLEKAMSIACFIKQENKRLVNLLSESQYEDLEEIKERINVDFYLHFPKLLYHYKDSNLEFWFKFNVLIKKATLKYDLDTIMKSFPNFKAIKQIKVHGVPFLELTLGKGEIFYNSGDYYDYKALYLSIFPSFTPLHIKNAEEAFKDKKLSQSEYSSLLREVPLAKVERFLRKIPPKEYSKDKLYYFYTSAIQIDWKPTSNLLLNCVFYFEDSNDDGETTDVTCSALEKDLKIIITPDIFLDYFEKLKRYSGHFESYYPDNFIYDHSFNMIKLVRPNMKPILRIITRYDPDELVDYYYDSTEDLEEYVKDMFMVERFD